MYNPDNDIEIRYNTKHLPIEYKLLEWRLIINRELYEDKVIDLEVFSEMEKSILGRMTKIRNEYKDKQIVVSLDDLTRTNKRGNMAS